jgi:hypothetical protein
MRKMRLALALLLATIVHACDGTHAPRVVDGRPLLAVSPGCQNTEIGEEFYQAFAGWDCGTVISIEIANWSDVDPLYRAAVDTARLRWNAGLATTVEGFPVFAAPDSEVTAMPRVVVVFDLSDENGTKWCGSRTRNPSVSYVNVKRTTLSDGAECLGSTANRIVPDLVGVLMHELGNVYGFDDPTGIDTLPHIESCVSRPPDAPTPYMNKTVCEHERQQVYRVWGFRDYGIDFMQPLRSALGVSGGSGTVLPGDTLVYSSGGEEEPAVAVVWVMADTSIARIASYTDTAAVVIAQDRQGEGTTLTATAHPDSSVVWPWPTASTAIDIEYLPFLGTYEDDATWQTTDQYLVADSAVGRGSHMRFHWRADTSESWTGGTAADSVWDFPGHGATGDHLVSYRAVNTTSHDTTVSVLPVTVTSGAVSLTGDLYVTNKIARVYRETAHLSGYWWERYNPEWTWVRATAECCAQDTLRRIWPAGDYTVEVREEVASSSTLKRGRLHVTRCHFDLDPCEEGMQAPNAAAAGAEVSGGIFGAGPWISWRAPSGPQAVRFYDLFGAHDAPEVFETPGWLAAPDGVVVDDAAVAPLAWARTEFPGTRAAAYTFTIAPRADGAAYVFGFAVDPDLGVDPADDRTGYDASRGLVYVYDAQQAVGFLLLDPEKDALRSVQEFGVGRWAPTTAAAAWEAQRTDGVSLMRTPRDVQLLLSGKPVSGSTVWVVVMIEGATVAEVQAAVDTVTLQLQAR